MATANESRRATAARRRLLEAKRVDAVAETRHAKTRGRLHAAIRLADEAGVPKVEIAKLSGMARNSVYDVLRATKGES